MLKQNLLLLAILLEYSKLKTGGSEYKIAN